MISCTSETYRRAYGWQRNGGMAPYIIAEEKDLVLLPDELSFADGAQVACGFGTVYEGLEKIGIGGNDAVLITGLGPVGLAAAMLCKAMILFSPMPTSRRTRFAKRLCGLTAFAFLICLAVSFLCSSSTLFPRESFLLNDHDRTSFSVRRFLFGSTVLAY